MQQMLQVQGMNGMQLPINAPQARMLQMNSAQFTLTLSVPNFAAFTGGVGGTEVSSILFHQAPDFGFHVQDLDGFWYLSLFRQTAANTSDPVSYLFHFARQQSTRGAFVADIALLIPAANQKWLFSDVPIPETTFAGQRCIVAGRMLSAADLLDLQKKSHRTTHCF
ncbi:hypothetical protein BV898_02410 [Hypsibius exemplaris]|uniref:Uncharacterized protein n=1 Tax=Hypsibius exemplaris TaxID=2072580 RepID=A0A1W0X8F8_HYPEX|nr:hypothetical protein BV898_02410 [Hypsibius exemplaris]